MCVLRAELQEIVQYDADTSADFWSKKFVLAKVDK